MKCLLLLLALSLAISTTISGQAPTSGPLTIHPINNKSYTDPSQFSFLQPILKDVEVVSLGESIHMTHEFPLVRLGIIKYLNQNLGFHVLAMEGSTEDIWVAQDRFLNSTHTLQDAKDAQSGLFGLWNTPEVRQVFEYEATSWATANPFYVTAYDIQPGTGNGSHGSEVFRLLAERLRSYAPPPQGLDPTEWINDLALLTRGCNAFKSPDQARVERAIQSLQQWIELAAPEAEKRFPNLPHGTVLRMIPSNLRASLLLCQDMSQLDWSHYKGRRDTHASQYALQLKNAVPQQKLILWAHISHIFHNDEHGATSVGEGLHRTLGPRLYTIAPFAEGGGAIIIYDDNKDDIGYGRVHGARNELEQQLSRLSTQDYFLDMRQPGIASQPNSLFASRQPLWVETSEWRLALARDFDGIIWIKTVHAPDFPFMKLLVLSALHYTTYLVVLGFILFAGAVLLVVRFFVRRRRKRAIPR